jgi:hypothetical protein
LVDHPLGLAARPAVSLAVPTAQVARAIRIEEEFAAGSEDLRTA